jgi:hypothetical protein
LEARKVTDELTRPENYAELLRRRQLTGRILANPCWFCIHGTGFKEAAACRNFINRTFKNCVNDGMAPKFELNDAGRAELEKVA